MAQVDLIQSVVSTLCVCNGYLFIYGYLVLSNYTEVYEEELLNWNA